jgi:hypothetical protein
MLQATTAQKPGPDGWPKVRQYEEQPPVVATISVMDPNHGIVLAFANRPIRWTWMVTQTFIVADSKRTRMGMPVTLQAVMN